MDNIQPVKTIFDDEQRFKWFFVNAPIPYHILNSDGLIIDVNQCWCNVLGYSKDEVIGREIFDFIVPGEQESARNSFQNKKISHQQYIEGSERRYQTQNGSVRVFKTHDYLVMDKKKKIKFIQTTIEDITRQKEAEEQNQRMMKRMRSLVNILQNPTENSDVLLKDALDEALGLTKSQFGFIALYDKSNNNFPMCIWAANDHQMIDSLNSIEEFHHIEKTPLWEQIISQKSFTIINDTGIIPNLHDKLPQDHIYLLKYLAVPIISDGDIKAVVSVINKATDYDESDALQISLLMESVWKIIDQRKALSALNSTEAKHRFLFDAAKDLVILKDSNFKIIMANKAAQQFYKMTEDQIIGKTDFDLMPQENAAQCRLSDQEALNKDQLVINIEPVGDLFYETRKFPVPLDDQTGLGVFIQDITAKIKSDESLKLQSAALNAAANAIAITDPDANIEWVNPAFTTLTGYTLQECYGKNPRDLVKTDKQDKDFYKQFWNTIRNGKVWKGRITNHRKDGSNYLEEMTITPLINQKGKITHLISIKEDVTESDMKERELTVVAKVSSALRIANSREEMLPVILDQLIEQLDVEAATIVSCIPNSNELLIELGRGLWASATGVHVPEGKGLSRMILDSGKPYLSNNGPGKKTLYKTLFSNCKSTAAVPMSVQNQKIGVLFIGSNRALGDRDIRLLTSISDIAANAIHRATLHEQTQQKVSQLNSLRIIDQTINTSLDLKVTLNVLLKQSKQLLGCDALAILLNKPHSMVLEHAASLGFTFTIVDKFQFQSGSGIAGQSILARQIKSEIITPKNDSAAQANPLLKGEKFHSYHSAPLIVKGDVKGVMMAFYRKPFNTNSDWLAIYQTLAMQTAIAINNHELFDGLQRSNTSLMIAYNETIEGWAKALELRDNETKGHSQRVINLTISLAQEMGVDPDEIGNIMRGALLHDIGKMGIPDSILHKPGKLSEEEWEIVRKHPQYAYDMLSSIKYLQPALDIPYCHHERWDGTGYPRGLKGEEIPLAARIFAIIDVWDALISDRPYRKAWSKLDALNHIQNQSGKHFDPRVVNHFLMIIANEPS